MIILEENLGREALLDLQPRVQSQLSVAVCLEKLVWGIRVEELKE